MMRPSLTTSVAAAAACLFVAASAAAEAKPKANPPVAADAKLDCNAFETAAKELFSKGSYGASLKQAEAAAKCTGTNAMATIAATAACKIKNSDRARYWSAHVEGAQLQGVVQACLSAKIVLSASSAATSDCKALADAGRTRFSEGNYSAALSSFEAAMTCDPKQKLEALAGIAACKINSKVKAASWAARSSDGNYNKIVQACAQAGIELPAPPAPAKTK